MLRKSVLIVVVAAVAGTLGFVVAHASARMPAAPQPIASERPTCAEPSPGPLRVGAEAAPLHVSPASPMAVDASDAGAAPEPSADSRAYGDHVDPVEARERLSRRVLLRLSAASLSPFSKSAPVDTIGDYLSGIADAVDTLGPDVAEEMQQHLSSQLCDANTDASQRAAWLRLASLRPSMAGRTGLQCALEREDLSEGPEMWDALDAWRKADLGESPALDQLEAGATSTETRARLQAMRTGEPLPAVLFELSGMADVADEVRAEMGRSTSTTGIPRRSPNGKE